MNMQDDETYLVEGLINYLYGVLYENAKLKDLSLLDYNVEMYAIGEKYESLEMKCITRREVETLLPTAWDKKDPANDRFWNRIVSIYGETVDSDRGLRDVAIKAITSVTSKAITKEQQKKIMGFLQSCPGLSSDLAFMHLQTLFKGTAAIPRPPAQPFPWDDPKSSRAANSSMSSMFSGAVESSAPPSTQSAAVYPGLGGSGSTESPRNAAGTGQFSTSMFSSTNASNNSASRPRSIILGASSTSPQATSGGALGSCASTLFCPP